ncbi:hypothetical protein [Methanobrevibacter sp. DSM 116169]|uniref:hypothetical protein n=1 Tax=Methanobrevibacter sp. DSM 116169 TaxID=3242727 RepID=UPI0038FC2973
MNNEELMNKCETCQMNSDNEIAEVCASLLNHAKECGEDIGIDSDQIDTYMGMLDSLKPKDLRAILQLAFDIDRSTTIKDTELKRDASRLIRAIERS